MKTIDSLIKAGCGLVCAFIMVACDDKSPLPSDEAVLSFYMDHSDDLKTVVALCGENEAIKQVWLENNDVSFYEDRGLTSKTMEDITMIRSVMSKLNIITVQCSRLKSEDYHFRGTNFTLYAIGLSVSGEVKGIDYDTPWSLSHSPYLQRLIDSGALKKINEDGWYIFHSM
ncbi:hypothetical protein FE236_13055 [Mariprofundus erugo]|uniref:hypothetical protein n=1 Tax=Mariprofundus erugo TaxID=2528639 RepID=UPI0010FF41D3|nr:hypothetical protein [Mariprofundus erugo]TLS73582.1 hypothetical protein FE236_13055 [Mariprofundus erugo]